jgi:mRNA interferase HicA
MWLGYFEEFPEYLTQGELVRELKENLRDLYRRRGGKHDWYQNPKSGISQLVHRHREIKEFLAKHILKKLED